MLEEIRDVNAQHEGVTFDQLIDKHLDRERKEIEEEEQIDEALAKCVWIRIRMYYGLLYYVKYFQSCLLRGQEWFKKTQRR